MTSYVDVSPFFEPRGVVLVGARRTPGFGYGLPLVLSQMGWADRIHLVSPNGGELHGFPVYRRVEEVPDPVDLAVVVVPAHVVPDMLPQIASRGIRHVIIESAGFAEAGPEGRTLQARIGDTAAAYGLRVLGPNCMGVINTRNRFTTSDIIEEAMVTGRTAIIAQSGAFGSVLLDALPHRGLGISKAVTLGNRMDVDECDILEYFRKDEDSRTILMYLEGAADGPKLRETLARVTREKPVLILKSGRTSPGKAATQSHTGSLSGEDALYDALFAQTGAVRAGTLDELVEMARVFTTQPLPRGPGLGIVTSSGSLGALATDVAVSDGLTIPELAPSTVKALRETAPPWINIRNPLDMGPSNQYAKGFAALTVDPHVHMVLAVTIIPYAVVRWMKTGGFTPDMWFGKVADIRETAPEKPMLICSVAHPEFIEDLGLMAGPGVPVLQSPETAARSLSALYGYSMWKRRFE